MKPTQMEIERLIDLLGTTCQEAHKALHDILAPCPTVDALEKAADAYKEYQLFTGKRGPVGPIVFNGRLTVRGEEDPRMTDQLLRVLSLVMQGLSNKEAARSLNIVEGTVKLHIKRLMFLTSCRNRTELALWGYSNHPELKHEFLEEKAEA